MSWFRRDKLTPLERMVPKIGPPSTAVERTWRAGEWNDLTADWYISPSWTGQLTQRYLSNLRARARQEYRNNDYAKRYVGMLKNGVVGPDGFSFQARFEDARGIDTVANQAFERWWHKWADNPDNCDVAGRWTLTDICHQLIASCATDGEIFLQWHRRGPMGYQLQVVEPLSVDLTYNDELSNGNLVRFGIEIDSYGKAIAYYQNVGQSGDNPYPTGTRQRIPAASMYHIFLSEGIDQLRGFPWLSTSMYRMHMLDGFEENAAVNARAGAAKMGFKQQRDPERYQGEGGSGAGVEEIYPGVHVDHLAENEEWVTHDPTYPSGEFKDYVQQMLRGVSSGLEVSYPTLSNDIAGVNYTSLRHDSITEREVYMRLQGWFSKLLLQRIYRDWLDIQLAEGIPIPRIGGGSRPAAVGNREKYQQVRFAGRRWQWVDPLKEMQAAREGVDLGVLTRAQIIRDQGRDPEEVFIEVELENERFGTTEQPYDSGTTSQPDDSEESDADSEGDQ